MDHLLVASGTSSRHVKSLSNNVLMKKAKEQGSEAIERAEGEHAQVSGCWWISATWWCT